MGAGISSFPQLISSSNRQFFRNKLACVVPRRNIQQVTKVILFSQCTTDSALQCAVSLIERSEFAIRVHATTDNYDNVKRLCDDKILLKYLNKEFFLHKIDLMDEKSTEETLKEIIQMEGTIDILVCYIDEISNGLADECSNFSVTKAFDDNFFSPLTLLKSVIPILKAQTYGQIIFINRIASIIGCANYSIYCASKFAVENLLESLASECVLHDIKFSVIQTPLRTPSDTVLQQSSSDILQNGIKEQILTEHETNASNQTDHIKKEFKVKKITNCIIEIMNTQKPYFRYTVSKECSKIMKEKLQDFRGTKTINEISRFFLNIDVDVD